MTTWLVWDMACSLTFKKYTPWNGTTAGIRLVALGFRETIIFQPSILGAKVLVSGRAIQQKIRISAPDELDLRNKKSTL